jgi:hypothetical protein
MQKAAEQSAAFFGIYSQSQAPQRRLARLPDTPRVRIFSAASANA